MTDLRCLPCGDRALTIELGDTIDLALNRRVLALAQALNSLSGVVETVPTYRSLLVEFDPARLTPDEIVACARAAPVSTDATRMVRRVTLPTVYGGEYGPDLAHVAEVHALSVDEVIDIHTGRDYPVFMLGFSPGFPYLGGLDERIATPRLDRPRTKVPAGSVGIADRQTGVYPQSTPGGWQIIGRTPAPLFDPRAAEPVLLRAGDLLRFRRVTADEYEAIVAAVGAGRYTPETEVVAGA
ncbi:MAG: 5-oxoprolinase subunit PxpB [Chloroflexota bacterium]